MARHFVGLVASIDEAYSNEGRGYLTVQISDGAYALEAKLENVLDGAAQVKSCQSELHRLIKTGRIFVG